MDDATGDIFVSSIACTVHGPDIAIHVLINGTYHRWQEPCGAPGCFGGQAGKYRNVNCPACGGLDGRYVPAEPSTPDDERLAALLDGTLPAEERNALLSHLVQDRSAYETYDDATSIVRHIEGEDESR